MLKPSVGRGCCLNQVKLVKPIKTKDKRLIELLTERPNLAKFASISRPKAVNYLYSSLAILGNKSLRNNVPRLEGKC
jgi:hypothetical protein